MDVLIHRLPWQQIAVLGAVYIVSIVFYRLYLHPLSKFPGPKLAAATRWYEAYHDVVLDGQYTFKIAKLHETYGELTP